jgi:hypothetical protein
MECLRNSIPFILLLTNSLSVMPIELNSQQIGGVGCARYTPYLQPLKAEQH